MVVFPENNGVEKKQIGGGAPTGKTFEFRPVKWRSTHLRRQITLREHPVCQ